ncbi:unnamed protein product [Prorocentrum cordatum]|uniref:Uncharacterized protein n=1 Tax=Prorocentrum cordatum TaxID=2364126 RepID=A0ABN9RFE9_9DINO|nr:unnamed protein product [Polarella glacialis]
MPHVSTSGSGGARMVPAGRTLAFCTLFVASAASPGCSAPSFLGFCPTTLSSISPLFCKVVIRRCTLRHPGCLWRGRTSRRAFAPAEPLPRRMRSSGSLWVTFCVAGSAGLAASLGDKLFSPRPPRRMWDDVRSEMVRRESDIHWISSCRAMFPGFSSDDGVFEGQRRAKGSAAEPSRSTVHLGWCHGAPGNKYLGRRELPCTTCSRILIVRRRRRLSAHGRFGLRMLPGRSARARALLAGLRLRESRRAAPCTRPAQLRPGRTGARALLLEGPCLLEFRRASVSFNPRLPAHGPRMAAWSGNRKTRVCRNSGSPLRCSDEPAFDFDSSLIFNPPVRPTRSSVFPMSAPGGSSGAGRGRRLPEFRRAAHLQVRRQYPCRRACGSNSLLRRPARKRRAAGAASRSN